MIVTSGVELINHERRTQLSLGYISSWDDVYKDDELIYAAMAYLAQSSDEAEYYWPDSWGPELFEQIEDKTPLRRLVIAGALIAAEIDRRLRLGEKQYEGGEF